MLPIWWTCCLPILMSLAAVTGEFLLFAGPMRRPANIVRKQLVTSGLTDAGNLTTMTQEWNTLPEDPFPLVLQTAPMRAIAILTPQSSNVRGSITFEQNDANAPVTISGRISGLTSNGTHGLHIHSSGDFSNGCNSAAGHFNPQNLIHGGPTNIFRHAGDLGNIQANDNGEAVFNRSDVGISLSGAHSALGRAVVLHALADDLGRGNDTGSLTSGNAGARIACGIIGIQQSLA